MVNQGPPSVHKKGIKDSKMQALAKFDAEFSKPGEKNTKNIDALYFRGNERQ